MPDTYRGMDDVYWFAGEDATRDYAQWRPCLQTPYGCYPLSGIWFRGQSECESFIGDLVVKADFHA